MRRVGDEWSRGVFMAIPELSHARLLNRLVVDGSLEQGGMRGYRTKVQSRDGGMHPKGEPATAGAMEVYLGPVVRLPVWS